jgi:hypothetical protein
MLEGFLFLKRHGLCFRMSLAEAQWVIVPALKKYAFPRFHTMVYSPHINPSFAWMTENPQKKGGTSSHMDLFFPAIRFQSALVET